MKKMVQLFKGKSLYRYSFIVAAVLVSAAVVYAASVPYTFSSGTVAKSSEVNANFQALADAMNNRTSATLANMAGTWNYRSAGSFLDALNGNRLCTNSHTGTLTLNADGTWSDNQADTNNYCQGGGVQTNTGATFTGTWTVSANGSGTITYGGGYSLSFQASKDLNTMISAWNSSTGNFPGNGTATYVRQ